MGELEALRAENEALKLRVAWLEGELGLAEDAEANDRLRRHLSLTPQEAWTIHAMYQAFPRPMQLWALEDAMPHRLGGESNTNFVRVLVHRLRRKLGEDAIERQDRAYRLSPRAAALVGVYLASDSPPTPTELDVVALQTMSDADMRMLVAHCAGILAHREGGNGEETAVVLRRIADRLTGVPRAA